MRRRGRSLKGAWVRLIEQPAKNLTAGLTAYRTECGFDDLFSVFVMFSEPSHRTGHWERAKIFALVDEMESRLPQVGERLTITAGLRPVAYADVIPTSEKSEVRLTARTSVRTKSDGRPCKRGCRTTS